MAAAVPWKPDDLDARSRKALRAQAHPLDPVVRVGKGTLTDGVVGAVDAALTTHALIKVKLLQACTLDAREVGERLAEALGAALIQRIGRTVVLYRPLPKEEQSGG